MVYLFVVTLIILVGSAFIINKPKLNNVAGLQISLQVSPTQNPTSPPTPTLIPFSVTIKNAPKEITEGGLATFTWSINGASGVIHTTTIYYGEKSNPQVFTTSMTPENSQYTFALKDFLQGNYVIPLEFIANAENVPSGTYYFRGYAFINGQHYWTNEQIFLVKEKPLPSITIIDPPTKVRANENFSFTWDISGPTASTDYTTIVASRESKPGLIENTIDRSQTPYNNVLVDEFTQGKYDVPLRFVGNTSISESGTYYIRATAKINDKYLWSDEYTLKIE